MDSEFRKNFLALFTGTTLAQVIPFLFIPLLSRIFTTEDYAVYGLYVSILEVLAIVVAGKYELTLVLPKKDQDAIHLALGALLIASVFSFFIFILSLFFGDSLAEKLNNPALAQFLYFLPLSLFFYAITRVLNNYLIRKEKYKAIAAYKLSHKTGEALSALGLGYFKISNGLIFGDIFGRLLLAILTIKSSLKHAFVFRWESFKKVKELLYEYREFPIYNSLPSVFNSMATLLPVFLISALYDEQATGSFNFARSILVAPLALISTSVSQILSQKLSQLYNERKSIIGFLKPLTGILVILAIAMILLLYFGGAILFKFIFGDEWEIAGQITSVLVFAFALQFVLTSLYPVFYILKSIKISSIWQVFYFMMIGSLYFFNDLEFFDFLSVFVILNVISFAIYGGLIYFVITKYEKTIAGGASTK